MLKTHFILKTFKFLPRLFNYVEERLGKKDKVNFKSYDVTDCTSNNCNTHTTQYLKK